MTENRASILLGELMTESDQDEQEEAARELLDDFVPDLLTRTRTEVFVRRLLAAAPGRWVSVRTQWDRIEGAEDFFRALDRLSDTDLFVVWLDHPGEASDFVFIPFYM